jgi:hypothetical protein
LSWTWKSVDVDMSEQYSWLIDDEGVEREEAWRAGGLFVLYLSRKEW